MKEQLLQKQLLAWINEGYLLDNITGIDRLDEAIKMDDDEHMFPQFAIDDLLKQKYSRSAKHVLSSLENYEIVSGEKIQNISLNKKEALLPDIILFNRKTCQVVIVENKTSFKTEREALTELIGYSHEIKNHLPFFSNYDINYILISTEFNTLLDHSISGQILTGDIQILCLKPLTSGEDINSLEVYFPKSWSDVGQTDLPANALVSYTLCLYENEDLPIDTFNYQAIIEMAADLIVQEAARFSSHGFSIVWKNGLERSAIDCKAAITIYIINSYAFLPRAYELGFPINRQSILSKYLMDYIEEEGTRVYPSSIFGIAQKAKRLLEKYFTVEWERASNWVMDTMDFQFALQRYVLLWNSWGVIGDYVRHFYLHPSNWFTDVERKAFKSYRNPYAGLLIINYLSGNAIFRTGHFSHQEIFKFGLQIGKYRYACINAAAEGPPSRFVSVDALLFWTALPLNQSIKEIEYRLRDMRDNLTAISFPLRLRKEDLYPDQDERINRFVQWFKEEFINEADNPTAALLFQMAVDHFQYFDFFLYQTMQPVELESIEAAFARVITAIVIRIAIDRLKNPEQNTEILDFISQHYFSGSLFSLSLEQIRQHLSQAEKAVLCTNIEKSFLPLLDMIKGTLLHQLHSPYIPGSVDLQAFKASADKLFEAGYRNTAIIISANNHIVLGRIDTPMKLASNQEVFVQFYSGSTRQTMTLRKPWTDLLDRDFLSSLMR